MSARHTPSRRSHKKARRSARPSGDFTGRSANNRVLRINLGVIRYGTDDKTHAAAVVFSLLLFAVIVLVVLAGIASSDHDWTYRVLQWLGMPFSMVIGVAIGRASQARASGAQDLNSAQ